MRAFLLAAGLGTRLRPLTDRLPKCLVPIAGRPLLSYWFELLAAHRITDVMLNSHHHPEQVHEYLAHVDTPLRVSVSYEPTLLGSAGTVRANADFVRNESDFFILYADTLTDADLTALAEAHRGSRHLATLGLFRAPNPRSCGIAIIDAQGTIVEFEEKPAEPRSDLAFAGVMVATPSLLDELPTRVPCDLGSELGRLAGRLGGYEISAYFRDIGTPESHARAEEEVASVWSIPKRPFRL